MTPFEFVNDLWSAAIRKAALTTNNGITSEALGWAKDVTLKTKGRFSFALSCNSTNARKKGEHDIISDLFFNFRFSSLPTESFFLIDRSHRKQKSSTFGPPKASRSRQVNTESDWRDTCNVLGGETAWLIIKPKHQR